VGIEKDQIDQLFAAYKPVLLKVSRETPDFIELAALATMLHSFYTGIENIFKRIAMEIAGSIPTGMTSHSDMLTAMTQPAANRSPVISEELRMRLGAYLGFRHVFRHAYSFDLEWSKMQGLVTPIETTWGRLKTELDQFFATN
jgi:hypothetical protein